MPSAARNLAVSSSMDTGLCIISLIMMVEESCSRVDLYTRVRDGSVEVPSTSSCYFEFVMTFRE